MEKSFISQVAEILIQESKGDFKRTAVVFSNRRAQTFLSQSLISLHSSKDFWLPAIFSTDDFIQHFTGYRLADNFKLQTILFQAYSNVLGNEAEPFDDFVQWAAMMLNDFDEVDQHLVDADKIFNYLSEAKAIEIWNVNGEPLTRLQKSYLLFYQNLRPIYHDFKKILQEQNVYFRGMIYKDLAENIDQNSKMNDFDKIYFCGLNALLFSEKQIIKKLIDKGIGKLIWDADSYYLDNKQQEAGQFLRSNEKLFGKIKSIKSNSIIDQEKVINIVAAELQTGQVNFLAEYLRIQNKKNRLHKTAVVLADESISDAVLQALPEEIKDVNFTIGYSLSKSLLAQWLMAIFNLKAHNEKNFDSKLINHELVRSVFKNKLFEILFDIKTHQVDGYISAYIKYIKGYEKASQFENILNKFLFEKMLIKFDENPIEDIKLIANQKNIISDILTEKSNELLFIHEVFEALNDLISLLSDCKINFSYNFIAKAIQAKLSEVKIPFQGKPINQLQIMGILETRNLDFEDVIFLSVNEGILPESSIKKSFITNDIKAIFNLPTGVDREAVFSYHFYRLFQRAQNITLVYNSTRTDEISGEPSRYIMQIEKEWPLAKTNLFIKNYKPEYLSNSDEIITIEKNEIHLSKLKEWAKSGISFSALNTYLKCSLQFYFKYLLKINAIPDELDNSDEMDLGIIVHDSLERLYKPFVNTFLDENLKNSIYLIDQTVQEVLQSKFPLRDFKTGTSFLICITAKHLIEKLIQFDIKQLKDGNIILIKSLEEKLLRSYFTSLGEQVLISGTFDRIDYLNETPRILDYKTGVTSNTIKIRDTDDVLKFDNDKQRQLLLYQWISGFNHSVSGIVPLQNLTGGIKLLSNETELKTDELVQALFEQTIEKMFNQEEYFVQTENTKACQYCDYVSICKRAEK